jgi:hypothetical protein
LHTHAAQRGPASLPVFASPTSLHRLGENPAIAMSP